MYIPDHVPELIAAAISKNRIRDAQDLIEQALSSMPAHWTPWEEDDKLQDIEGEDSSSVLQ